MLIEDEHSDTHRSATPDGLKAAVGLWQFGLSRLGGVDEMR